MLKSLRIDEMSPELLPQILDRYSHLRISEKRIVSLIVIHQFSKSKSQNWTSCYSFWDPLRSIGSCTKLLTTRFPKKIIRISTKSEKWDPTKHCYTTGLQSWPVTNRSLTEILQTLFKRTCCSKKFVRCQHTQKNNRCRNCINLRHADFIASQ